MSKDPQILRLEPSTELKFKGQFKHHLRGTCPATMCRTLSTDVLKPSLLYCNSRTDIFLLEYDIK